MTTGETSPAANQASEEENYQAIADYDPLFEREREIALHVHGSNRNWIIPVGGAAFVAAAFLATPKLAKLFTHDPKPIRTADQSSIDNAVNCQYIKPRLINASRKVLKFAASNPDSSHEYLRENRIITVVSGRDGRDKSKIRVVTKRHDNSRKIDPQSALSLTMINKRDDGAGDRWFESVVLAAPKGETSPTRPYKQAKAWFASERTHYVASHYDWGGDYYSSAADQSSLVADNTQQILEDTLFTINFDYKVPTTDPKDQDRSCSQLAKIPRP